MILNRRQIELMAQDVGLIEPLFEDGLQAASYDFRVSDKWAVTELAASAIPIPGALPGHDYLKWPEYLKLANAPRDLAVREVTAPTYVLGPGECVLAQSVEFFRLPSNLVGQVKAKSSLGRLFISVSNGDACYFDPGFHGVAVLEIVNHNKFPICLDAGMKIGQMFFEEVDGAYVGAYDGHFQTQTDFASAGWLAALSKIGTNLKLGVK